jgi:hypothetical protein
MIEGVKISDFDLAALQQWRKIKNGTIFPPRTHNHILLLLWVNCMKFMKCYDKDSRTINSSPKQ